MPIGFSKWQMHPGTDRDAFARAALSYCRALRTMNQRGRFYWSGTNDIAVVVEADTTAALFADATPEAARAAFALSDLANRTAFETWAEPGRGEQTYRLAGR